MTASLASASQEEPLMAAMPERVETEPAPRISDANTPPADHAAAISHPVSPLPQYNVPLLPQYLPPLPQYVPPHPQHFPPSVPPQPVMGIPVASPWPARCAKPEDSNVVRTTFILLWQGSCTYYYAHLPRMLRRPQVISQGEGGALEVRIPPRKYYQDGTFAWVLTAFFALYTVAVAMLLPFTLCIPLIFALSAGFAHAWMRGATHTETIILSPDFFTVTITSLGTDKHRQGSTPWVRAIMVRDLDSPQPLPPPTVHSIAAHGPFPPPPAPAMHSPDAAASPRALAGFQPELVCAIVDVQQEYHFGNLLNNAEKYWVVGELSYHLHTMRMHPAQLNV
ncbi:unnamed protein product [Closterium sp. Yama58-4]|nr:unnamed protein product [Closterium sp. Yama58-4]